MQNFPDQTRKATRLGGMPWPGPETLTQAQERRLRAAEARVRRDEAAWAKLAREFGISASARSYGITASSMLKRVQRIERRSPKPPAKTKSPGPITPPTL